MRAAHQVGERVHANPAYCLDGQGDAEEQYCQVDFEHDDEAADVKEEKRRFASLAPPLHLALALLVARLQL